MNEMDKIYLRMRGLKLEDVATASGVNKQTIGRLIKNPDREPKRSTLNALNYGLDLMKARVIE